MLINNISISKFDSKRWVLNTAEGRNVLLNSSTMELIRILRNNEKYESAAIEFNQFFESNLDNTEFEELVHTKLSGLNILASDKISSTYRKGKYLNLKTEFLPAKLAGILSSPLTWIFKPPIFWFLIFLTVLSLALSIYHTGDLYSKNWAKIDFLLYAMLVYSSLIVHEVGHIAACRAAGVKHGGIGFAFYLIFPVVYADITNIWTASKQRRLIANLAGIFNELIYAGLLLLIFLSTQYFTLLVAAYTIIFKALVELNPFIRADGYWLLSDACNTPNLLQKANGAMIGFISNPAKTFKACNKQKFGLLMYALINTAAILIYASYIIINYQQQLLRFPQTVSNLIVNTFNGHIKLSDFKAEYILLLGFYALILHYLYILFKRYLRFPQLVKPGG